MFHFVDAVPIAATRQTADGYLIATAKAVRTGVQLYAGYECGIKDKAVVRVYRSPEEVFAQDSLQSFSHAPITIDHPSEAVTSENVRSLAVGEVSTAAHMDGKWVSLPLILKDAEAIKAVQNGKRQLSAGYTCQLDPTPGVTADGEAYDARQIGIKINHLALVDKARAGDEACIVDGAADGGKDRKAWGAAPITVADTKESLMADTLRKVMVDGLQVETTDAGAAAIEKLTKDKDTLQTKLSDAETAHASAIAAKDAEIAKKDAAIDDLKGKILSDADLDKRVQDRADLIALASAIAKDVKTAGLSDADIRKTVVSARLGDAAIAGKTAAYVDARFDILAEDAKSADPFRKAIMTGDHRQTVGDTADRDAAYQEYLDSLNPRSKGAK